MRNEPSATPLERTPGRSSRGNDANVDTARIASISAWPLGSFLVKTEFAAKASSSTPFIR